MQTSSAEDCESSSASDLAAVFDADMTLLRLICHGMVGLAAATGSILILLNKHCVAEKHRNCY